MAGDGKEGAMHISCCSLCYFLLSTRFLTFPFPFVCNFGQSLLWLFFRRRTEEFIVKERLVHSWVTLLYYYFLLILKFQMLARVLIDFWNSELFDGI